MIALAIMVIALATLTAGASAAATRGEYVADVDPICHSAHSDEKHIQRSYKKQIRKLVRQGLNRDNPNRAALRATVGFADRVSRVARSEIADIASVPPAPGDESTISDWLGLKTRAVNYFQRAFHAFARNQKPHQYRRLLGKSDDARLDADSLLQGWGFRYCTPYLANP